VPRTSKLANGSFHFYRLSARSVSF
jgi:hypothetical protein